MSKLFLKNVYIGLELQTNGCRFDLMTAIFVILLTVAAILCLLAGVNEKRIMERTMFFITAVALMIGAVLIL